jgi:uncharacterized protein (TIGR02246 family)
MGPDHPPRWRRWAPTLLALALLLLALAVGPFGPWRRAGAGEPAEVERAVRQVLDEQVEAWNRGDLEGFMAGYWASPELSFFSQDKRTRGWEATLERYRRDYPTKEKRGRLAFRDVEVRVLGPDSAFVRGRYELLRGDDRPTGLFTVVFKRLPEGWRIVHDHTSTKEKK